MVQVVDDLAARTVDRAADKVGLRDLLEEEARVIRPPVQRLQDDHEAGRLGDLHATALVVDQVGRLVVDFHLLADAAGSDQRPLGVGSLGDLDGPFHGVDDLILELLVLRDERGFAEFGVRDERSQGHAEPVHFLGDLLLEFRRPARQAVVEHGGEALVGHELDLVDRVVAGVGPEGAEARRVLELELLRRLGGRNGRGSDGGRERRCGGGAGDEAAARDLRVGWLLMGSAPVTGLVLIRSSTNLYASCGVFPPSDKTARRTRWTCAEPQDFPTGVNRVSTASWASTSCRSWNWRRPSQ